VKLRDIAKKLGITPRRVSQIIKDLHKNDNVVQFRKPGANQVSVKVNRGCVKRFNCLIP
jgi:predicted transcriptional regulator